MVQLLEFLPQARDIGLHLVLTRSAGGAGQGMYEPVVRSLRDMGTPGVLLSGSQGRGRGARLGEDGAAAAGPRAGWCTGGSGRC